MIVNKTLVLFIGMGLTAAALPLGVKVDSCGALEFFGDPALIQFFAPGWKQVLQNQNSAMVEKQEQSADGLKLSGVINVEKHKINFDEFLRWSDHSLEAKFDLRSAIPIYANSVSLMISLLPAKYGGSVIVWDGKPIRLPKQEEERGTLPQDTKVNRLVIGNAQGNYVITGDLTASIVDLGYAYQLRIFFKPKQGNFTRATLALRLELGDATLSPTEKQMLKTIANKVFQANEQWKAVNTDTIRIQAGSALDLSNLTPNADLPAGKYGRLIVSPDGKAVFEKRPTVPVRFLGFNWIYGRYVFDDKMSDAEAFANIEIFSDLVRRQGYNIVRLHCLDCGLMSGSTAGDFMIPAQNWRHFDYLVKCFRERGIYLYVDLAIVGYYNGGWTPAAQKGLNGRMYWTHDDARAHWRTGAMTVLNHQIPDSGLALKNDPIVAGVLFFNEQDLSTMPWQGYSGNGNKMWQDGFHQWLKNKYRTIEAVKSAWNDPSTKDVAKFEEIEFNGTEKVPHGLMRNDMSLYYRDLQQNLMAFYKGVMTECGYTGLTTQYDVTKNVRGTSLRQDVDFVSMHDYGAHPSNSIRPGSNIGVGSTIAGTLWYWRSINQTRLLNKPMMVTEYAQGFWNPYAHEAGIAFPAYSAFQNFSAIMVHADAVALALLNPMDEFEHYRSPIFRANEFLAAHLFRRGDVKPSRGVVEVRIKEADAYQNGNAEDALNSNQASLALVTGFGVTYSPTGATSTKKWGDLVVEPQRGGACIVNTAFTSTVIDSKTENIGGNDDILNQLKSKGIVGRDNQTDFARLIFQSDTKELYLDGQKSLMTVKTGRTEAATLMPKKSVDLNCLKIKSTSVPALVAIVSIDGRPISESARLVLLYSTNAVNSGMELSNDLTTLYKQGNLPILMECGTLEIELKNSSPLELWALALDGSRRESLSVESSNGTTVIKIDTAKLSGGPTPFFELARKLR